ncbi:hypothetical protein CEE45_01590 [Candidatus Heimdallarchaeota archaeon B3_Heim]|nr:MAG: hypothetical protein CEE45_01590 [Candidatus Heimdallarchaeota archaeon B3_Heim]
MTDKIARLPDKINESKYRFNLRWKGKKEPALVIIAASNASEARRKLADRGKIDVLLTDTEYKDRREIRKFGLKSYYEDGQFIGWRGKINPKIWQEVTKFGQLTQGSEYSAEESAESWRGRRSKKAQIKRDQATKATQRSKAHWDEATKLGKQIPLGQPILVGHHSEKRHRRHIERIDSHGFKGLEEHRKAERLTRQAENLEYMARQKKGIAAQQHEAHRDTIRRRVKQGNTRIFFHGAAYGEGTVTKVFKKSARVKFDKSGLETTIDMNLLQPVNGSKIKN